MRDFVDGPRAISGMWQLNLLRPRTSAAGSGTETVGYTEPCWVRGQKVVRNGRTRLCTFVGVAAWVGNTSGCLH
jgi:hypothetical protein